MNKLKIPTKIFNDIKNGMENLIITKEDKLEKEATIKLVDYNTGEEIEAQITFKQKFRTIKEAIENIAITSIKNASEYLDFIGEVTVYRIKTDIEVDIKELIKDSEIYNIIDKNELKELKLGRSDTKVFKTKLKSNYQEVILKIQYTENKNNLKEEYERLKWIEGKLNTPKAYYYNEKDNTKYLIMEYKKGAPSFKFDDIGYQLGKALKQIHQVNIENCPFNKYSPEQLLSNFLDKLDSIYPEIQDNYKDETKETIIEFMKENIPIDKVLTHGDYSMPNILINAGEISFIDLGELGISTKYLDIYYLMKSLKINKKEEIFEEFLKGYGIDKINNNYIKWMDLINMSLC
nr:phosphotransferase [Clostridiales bacterium]